MRAHISAFWAVLMETLEDKTVNNILAVLSNR